MDTLGDRRTLISPTYRSSIGRTWDDREPEGRTAGRFTFFVSAVPAIALLIEALFLSL